ncbi:Acyl-CoA thioesterase 2 (plasmid) [Variovorax sp. SRS16]|uniref:acyl-CoA thioesterase n=1 Tax=Variovorax sp. SRS16 TaxID=282217 RepID=UPI001317A1AD|nr:acyl-CoA thioesterase domain-containing protein [Variovorax sp. SRS16]VTU45506.1 Acyl-CoA thioesterase 2 [Variovorax sp. SRS16]
MTTAMTAWDGTSLDTLLDLERTGPSTWRTRWIDMNKNGRAYGGQTLGQAMAAACASAPAERHPTAMQLMFLSGVRPHAPVDFEVTALQDGKRFASRHVRASQGTRPVADAHVSFEVPTAGRSHQVDISPIESDPERCVPLSAMPCEWEARLNQVSGYSLTEKPCLEFRIPEPERQLFDPAAGHRIEFWTRVRSGITSTPHARAAAFAYTSDWWLNYSGAGGHLAGMTASEALYGASLNHGLWLYAGLDPTCWMLFASASPLTRGGRGLSVAHVYDRSLTLRAIASQEGLMTPVAP